MENNTKFAIGCLVQWYEIEILHEYIDSIVSALREYPYPDNVIVDMVLVMNEQLERYDGQYIDFIKIPDRFVEIINACSGLCTLNFKVTYDLYTIADYRREFNLKYCNLVDLLIWGESDMLAPKYYFSVLDQLHQNIKSFDAGQYVATFGTCKMWDASWKELEHVAFTDKPFIENDYTNWWSLKYTMTQDEMDEINSKYDVISTKVIEPIKFNGCGLVIASEVVKAGVNIPDSMFFVHEDSAFMYVLQHILPEIKQIHFPNILLVHNRNHPNKRVHVKGEYGDTLNKRRRSNLWYISANSMSESNYRNLYTAGYIPYTWKDVFEDTK